MKTALKEAVGSHPSYSSVQASMDLSVNSDKVEYFALPNPGRRRVDSEDQGSLAFSLKRRKPSQDKWTLIVTIAALLATVLFLLVAFLVVVREAEMAKKRVTTVLGCDDRCAVQLKETLPEGLYPTGTLQFESIVDSWHTMLDTARRSIDIASSYWSLLDSDVPGGPYTKYSKAGQAIFDKLKDAATRRGIKIRIVQQVPDKWFPQKDTQKLDALANVEVRSLAMDKVTNRTGSIIHTKMWIVDGEHVYIGSANMDWRSITEVKEVGIVTYNCSCLANDVQKIFESYWLTAKPGAKLPKPWPPQYDTQYNIGNPLRFVDIKGKPSQAFIGASPPTFCPLNRTQDIDGLLNVITKAQQFIYISVMDYVPAIVYGFPKRYWGVIDDALKSAAYDRGIEVRLLASKWQHSPRAQQYFLKSLKDAGDAATSMNGSIQVKNFVIPPGSVSIPFTRVNHAKYMVTDKMAYIGTSNWAGDYFTTTGGVSYVISQAELPQAAMAKAGSTWPLQIALKELFERDWESKYTQDL